jgi:hypothetical protein
MEQCSGPEEAGRSKVGGGGTVGHRYRQIRFVYGVQQHVVVY